MDQLTHIVAQIVQGAAGVTVTVVSAQDSGVTGTYLIKRSNLKALGLTEGAEITEETVSLLADEADLCRAEARTVRILSYSDHSELALMRKLASYGFPEHIAKRAAENAVESGLIREDEQAARCVDYFIRHKYWGKKRIAMELVSRGYRREAINAAIEETDPETFVGTAAKLIEKKYPTFPATGEEKAKMISALSRMGYTISEVSAAMRKVYEGE